MTGHSRRPLVLIGAVAAALTLSACSGGVGTAPTQPEQAETTEQVQLGGVANIASLLEMPGFDPVKLANVGSGIERAALVMDTLLMRDDITDEVLPKLAKGISSDDGVTWVLELREGVTFTDGTPLDADAVIFNLQRHLAEDSTSAAKALLSGIDKMTATSEYEVTFTLKAASGSFPLALTGSSPASLIGSPAALADPDTFNEAPVGAGPFTLESWVRDDKLTVVKNPDYWDEGKPYLDGVVYKLISDNQTRTDDLLSGGSDLALVLGPSWDLVSGDDSLVLLPVPTGGSALIPNATKAPGDDPRVREAITMAIDPKVTATVMFGSADNWDGNVDCLPFPVSSPACAKGAVNAYDMEKAKKLIADYVADGGDVAVELVHFSATANEAAYYQQQLNEAGLNVTLRSVDGAGLAQAQSAGDYGIYLGSTASAGFPTVWNRYYSGGTNWGMVTYPELDEALLRARDEVALEDRNKAWQDVAKIIHEESMLTWTMPYTAAMTHSVDLHLGTPEHPYVGSTMVYFDTAWLSK